MTDEYVDKKDVVNLGVMMQTHLWTREQTYNAIFCLPTADVAPVRHEEDGTLWVTVGDCEKVGRVIIKNEQGHFCRTFYMGDGDEEPVVRCNDCKWSDACRVNGAMERWCERDIALKTVQDNDFCSWGERKDNGK